MNTLIVPALNLAVLIAGLVYYLRAPLREFLKQRHVVIRDELQRVRERLRQAQEKYDEYTAKLRAIDAEISGLRDQARQDGAAAKLRVVNEAKKLSTAIVTDAKGSVEGLFGDLRTQLYTEFGYRVIERAEILLRERLTGDDQARIRKEFSNQVENSP